MFIALKGRSAILKQAAKFAGPGRETLALPDNFRPSMKEGAEQTAPLIEVQWHANEVLQLTKQHTIEKNVLRDFAPPRIHTNTTTGIRT
jgi:hypothetical protein